MLIVARWSDTDCWKTMFSFFRPSPACFRLTCMAATWVFSSSISDSKEAIEFSKPSFLPSRSSFSCSLVLMVSSVLSISVLQKLLFCDSAFCCAFNSASILSMTSFTFVNGSSRTRTASEASTQFECFRAALRICFIASVTAWLRAASVPFWAAAPLCAPTDRWRVLRTCKKLIVFAYKSRASSVVNTETASLSACSSSERAADLFAYSSSLSLQLFFSVRRNCWSAERASFVASTSCSACAALAMVSASVLSFSSFEVVAAVISASLELRSFWKRIIDSRSCFCAVLRLRSKSSFISESMP
mmetsp:Transcript_88688/g.228739  ORF Transcript_88688/g.228739 Transcript_88688/m.228739 type:complete len:302 (+) Transcript_88688:641-1546(+)